MSMSRHISTRSSIANCELFVRWNLSLEHKYERDISEYDAQ